MPDIIDQANDIAQQTIERSLANAQKFDAPSRYECEECGEIIPPERRQLGGVIRCIDCQSHFELDKKRGIHYGG